jgi:hypothetical protein
MNFSKTIKAVIIYIFLFANLGCVVANAQEPQPGQLKYYNALNFRMVNTCFDNTLTPYTRIPKYLKDSVRKDLWERAQCSSGIAIRFSTNSKAIGIRYNLLWNAHMAHMADTGIKGTDLYCLRDDGVWEFVNCNRPSKDSIQTKVYVANMKGDMHEYMIYLPLYDGVNWMEIGVDSSAIISKPKLDNPRHSKKFIFYGTSILQGGCATRTGMVGTSIIQRDLDAECVNIGISGEGKMDNCMARAMGSIPDVTAYIIDPIPNCTKLQCDTLTYDFIKILRTMKPNVPIFMVEGPWYSYESYDTFFAKYLPQKNYEFHKNYLKLKKENPNNLYYIDRKNLWGPDNEGTVDGIHLTDIGFYYYAKKLEPYLKAILDGKKVPYQKEVDKPYKEIK